MHLRTWCPIHVCCVVLLAYRMSSQNIPTATTTTTTIVGMIVCKCVCRCLFSSDLEPDDESRLLLVEVHVYAFAFSASVYTRVDLQHSLCRPGVPTWPSRVTQSKPHSRSRAPPQADCGASPTRRLYRQLNTTRSRSKFARMLFDCLASVVRDKCACAYVVAFIHCPISCKV